MGNVQHINVYDKISKGEYICKSDELYTREEIREMLNSSGLKIEEIEMLYKLNADAARKGAMEMAEDSLRGQIGEEKVRFSTNSHVYDMVRALSGSHLFVLYLVGCQGLFVFIFLIAYVLYKDSLSVSRIISIISILLIISYLLAFVGAYILGTKQVQDNLELLEWICNDKVELAIMRRTRKLFSISNTLNMYDCMDDAIKARTGTHLNKNSRTEEPVSVDDLK